MLKLDVSGNAVLSSSFEANPALNSHFFAEAQRLMGSRHPGGISISSASSRKLPLLFIGMGSGNTHVDWFSAGIRIYRSDDDEAFIVEVPSLPVSVTSSASIRARA